METHDGMAATLLAIEQFSLGLDYLDRYPDIIARITRDDVLAAATQHLDPSRLAIGRRHDRRDAQSIVAESA